MKHWRLTFSGERSPDEIHSTVGASGGLVTRVQFDGEQTQVWVAGHEAIHERLRQDIESLGAPEEVSAEDVQTIE
jgi:hypothetical protein